MGRDQRANLRSRTTPRMLCIYCGTNPGTTKDHVPPKSLFPKPRPRLVTVPCCEACRQEQSKDDEYFKSRIALRHDVAEGLLGSRLADSVLRALARPEARGFATNLLQSVREVEVRSAAGLFLGHATTYHADLRRLDAVMQRTLLGLYFHETDVRLPDTHDAVVFSAAGLPHLNEHQRGGLERVVQLAVTGWVRVIGQDVFAYAFQGIPNEPHCSVWAFLVYNRAAFLGFTLHREDFS